MGPTSGMRLLRRCRFPRSNRSLRARLRRSDDVRSGVRPSAAPRAGPDRAPPSDELDDDDDPDDHESLLPVNDDHDDQDP